MPVSIDGDFSVVLLDVFYRMNKKWSGYKFCPTKLFFDSSTVGLID